MKYLSLFSGIGGFELGIGDGHECVGYSEVEPRSIEIYERHFKHKNFGDITKIDADSLPDFDWLFGGFPCQSFSLAGNRRGFDDTRGTLFFDIARIIKAKKPSNILLENVKGLLSHDGGRTFEVILKTLDELGYDAEWGVFDGTDFDSGQRPRVFIRATHRHKQVDDRQGAEQTFPLYSCLGQRTRITASALQESGRSAERIIRTFARLPDWMDSWDAVYGEEGKTRQRSPTQSG